MPALLLLLPPPLLLLLGTSGVARLTAPVGPSGEYISARSRFFPASLTQGLRAWQEGEG
jgi:hypothetical protein